MRERERLAGHTATLQTQIREARSLLPGTSAQKEKLRALTQKLELRTGKFLNVFTDFQYAHATYALQGYLEGKR